MAVDSLAMLLEDNSKMKLAESYGKVIDNLSKSCVSAQLKNTDLSGNPTEGSCKAKRFQNIESNAYGTARSGSAGQKTKGKEVLVSIDVDRELIEEAEQKDVTLSGVNGLIEKRASQHQLSMERELDRAFFACAYANAEIFTTSETTVKAKVDAMISAISDTKNEYVDGVDDDYIRIVLDSEYYTAMHEYMDKDVQSGDAKNSAFGNYHGVQILKSHRMPAGVHMLGMAVGAVAQPVIPNISDPAKVPFSNAIAFGLFYSYGTRAVAADLIQEYAPDALACTLASTTDKVAFTPVSGCTYMYKSAASVSAPAVGADMPASGWTAITNGEALTSATDTHKVRIIEINANDKVSRVSAELTVS